MAKEQIPIQPIEKPKWFLFLPSVFGLFVANNALFWLPGPYSWFNFVAATIGIVAGILLAYLSSRRFVTAPSMTQPTWLDVMSAPRASFAWVFYSSF